MSAASPPSPSRHRQFCRQCLSAELRPSRFGVLEYGLLLIGMRPLRCKHCFRRQYVVVNPLAVFLVASCRKVDEMVGLIHPKNREAYLSRRKRRRRHAARVSRRVRASE